MDGVGTHQQLPRQGGLPPPDALAGPVVEVACDESGFSGTNLLDPATPVFTHASVDIGVDEALDLVGVLKAESGWPLAELKSARVLRSPRAGELLGWLRSALAGRAHVDLVDKELFLATGIVSLFTGEPSYAAGTHPGPEGRSAARALYRVGSVAPGGWNALLAGFVALVRTTKRRTPSRAEVDRFLDAVESLARGDVGAEAAAVLGRIDRSKVCAVLSRLAERDPSIPPPLEPLLASLVETVTFWSRGRRPVLVIHDEQSALTADRLRQVQQVLSDRAGWSTEVHSSASVPTTVSPLVGLVTVDSRDDPRVQIADLLAGAYRRSAQGRRAST